MDLSGTVLRCAVAVTLTFLVVGCQSPNPLLRRQGYDALRINDLERAEQLFAHAVRQDPSDWRAQFALGKILLECDRPLEAQLTFERALATNDDYDTAIIFDGMVESLARQEKHGRLAEVLMESCRRSGSAENFLRQGRYLARIGDIDGAVLALRKAARFGGNDATAYVELANLYESIGVRDRAIESLRRGYLRDPHDQRIANRLREFGIVPGPTVAVATEYW